MQEVHCKVDPFEVTSRDGQVSGAGCAYAQDDRVEFILKLSCRDVLSNLRIDDELHASLTKQIHAAFDHPLFQFHIGDAVHQKSAKSI